MRLKNDPVGNKEILFCVATLLTVICSSISGAGTLLNIHSAKREVLNQMFI